MIPPTALLGTGEVAAMLGVSRVWVARQARAGRLPCLFVGGRYRFTAGDVAAIRARFRHSEVRREPVVLVWEDPPSDAWRVPTTRRAPLDVKVWAHG